MAAYYNENDLFAASWLRNLIAAGFIPSGDVDGRSIVDVQPDDLRGYIQCHFFAGIGGWAYAARLAGWLDGRELWTGSCPCQPFSVAGKGLGTDDARHLWPHYFRLICARRPAVVMGEQVAGAAGYGWLDGILADLAGEDYAGRGIDIPACAVDAPHIRQRLYWIGVADAGRFSRGIRPSFKKNGTVGANLHGAVTVEHSARLGRGEGQPEPEFRGGRSTSACTDASSDVGDAKRDARNGTFWSDAEWLVCHDGKARRTQPGTPLLAHGVPARVAKWRGLGNAIVPQVAAEVIAAWMECQP